jgi:hypothetical protein
LHADYPEVRPQRWRPTKKIRLITMRYFAVQGRGRSAHPRRDIYHPGIIEEFH